MAGAAGVVQLPAAAIVVALPTIHAEFGVSIAALQWTVTAFYIPESACLIAAGRLADTFGRRRLLVIGAVLFAIGSLLAVVSTGVVMLIAGIAITGLGGAVLMPASLSIITDVFTGGSRGFAVGIWGAATEVVSGAGVLLGGVLTGALSWRWIFVLSLVVSMVVALLALRWTPESRDPDAAREIDVSGVMLSITGLTAITLALVQGAQWGWGSPAVVGLVVAFVILAVAFLINERRSTAPIVDFSFFRRRNFAGATATIFVIDFAFGAMLFFLPIYLQEVLDYSPIGTGVLLLPMTGLMVLGSPIGGQLTQRVGPRPPILGGLSLLAIGVIWVSTLSTATTYADLWLPTSLIGLGIGIALTPMNLAAMNAVEPRHTGAAAGLLLTLSGLGVSFGVAITGAIFQNLQTSRTVDLVDATGTSITRDQAEQLDGLLAGSDNAQQALNQIAPNDQAAVTDAVEEAFVSALGTSLLISGLLVVAGAILAGVLIRNHKPEQNPEDLHPVGSIIPRPAPRIGRTPLLARSGTSNRALPPNGADNSTVFVSARWNHRAAGVRRWIASSG
ncbi:MAG: MFS transporter [Actinomycetota bacterium]